MEPFWPYYVFLMSWIQCFIVLWLAVAIETQSTESDGYSILDNSTATTATVTQTTRSLVTFVSAVMPTCPPPKSLHFLCDVKLSAKDITCKERADIIELCYNKHGVAYMYDDSNWAECESTCDEVVVLLRKLDLLPKTTTTTTTTVTHMNTTIQQVTTIKPELLTTELSIPSSNSTLDHTESTNTPASSNVTSSNDTSSNDTVVTLSPLSPSNTSSGISSTSSSEISSETANISTVAPPVHSSQRPASKMASPSDDQFPHLSWVYPFIGGLFILIEVIVLLYIFCYRKKKYGSPPVVGEYRRTSTGSMVIQEEALEAETTSPTQALCNGPGSPAGTDEAVFEEDQHIFRSYINLRYIDDTSTEGTPERVPVKT